MSTRTRVKHGTPIKEMNSKEQDVLAAIKRNEKGLNLKGIAGKVWEKKGTSAQSKGGSHVRNALRRLVAWGFAKKIGKGTYVWLSDTATCKEAIEPKARASTPEKKAKPKVVKAASKPKTKLVQKSAKPEAAPAQTPPKPANGSTP